MSFPLLFPDFPLQNTIVDFLAPSGAGKTTLAKAIWKAHRRNRYGSRGENVGPRLTDQRLAEKRAFQFLFEQKVTVGVGDKTRSGSADFRQYRWIVEAVLNESAMLEATEPASFQLSHDGLWLAFGRILLGLQGPQLEIVQPLFRNRVAVLLRVPPETIVARIKKRQESGTLRSFHADLTARELVRLATRGLVHVLVTCGV